MKIYFTATMNQKILILSLFFCVISCNEPPEFSNDLNNLVLSENTTVGSVIGTLKGTDKEGSVLHYGIDGTDLLSVDHDTGVVKLVKPLDREINESLRFSVTLEDVVGGELPNNFVKVPISIILDDVNDNAPKFKQTPYKVSVGEDTPVGSTIFSSIKVDDIDFIGNPLDVICGSSEDTDVCRKFKIQTESSNASYFEGVIILSEPLNYNEKQLYQLTLIASDGEFNSSTLCEIRVLDIQNLPPTFQSSLTAIVQEDAPPNTHVITVQAKDGDRGSPRNIAYELISNPFNYFQINSTSGELRTITKLDREKLADTNGVLSLTVKAREIESGVPLNEDSATATAEVSVTIRDVNDEPPTFNKLEYYVSIPENLPEGSPLPNLDMTVTDPDVGNNSAYSLRLQDVSGAFAVEPVSAVGTTAVIIRLMNNSLDYENPNLRKFIILVFAEETDADYRHSSSATLIVEVTDTNDNSPKFDNPTYMASVNESSLPGTVVTTITATDRDSGKNGQEGIVYEMIGDGADRFNVNKKTGVITVALCVSPGKIPCLDFELKPMYFLTYKATDEEGLGQSTSVQLKITLTDSNDNAPVFQSKNYTAVIEEGAKKFEPAFYIKAEDADKTSGIVYSIADEAVKGLFGIDHLTGEIFVISEDGVQRNNDTDTITFSVMADDGIYYAKSIVNVRILDVNNNVPKFMQEDYSVNIFEDVEIGTSVLTLTAADLDTGVNAEILYHIERGAFEDFTIDNETGLISTASKLDFDRKNQYNITVTATDGGTPILTGTTTVYVQVINTNDKDPFFEPPLQRADVQKTAKVNDVFYRMIALDPDTDDPNALKYNFVEPITAVDKYGKEVTDSAIFFKNFFGIKDLGEVYVKSPLQRDVAAVVTLTVMVTDVSAKHPQIGKGTLMITILDVNDIPPVFAPPWSPKQPYYVEQIQEEVPVKTVLKTFTASDPDSDIHHYAIEPESEYFAVNETTGVVTTKTRIDFEQVQTITFYLVAYDIGEPQLSVVANVTVNVININDMNPVFEKTKYEASIKENSPKDTYVINVTATDGDLGNYGRIAYSFKGDYISDFAIDGKTGVIKVANPASLDREKVQEILLKVEASDLASPEERRSAIVPVVIKIEDVNDNPPVFSDHLYLANIVETIPYSPGSPIVQLHAEDADEKPRLRYYIVNGNDEEAFQLDSSTGILYPKRSLLGLLKQFKLTVEVNDGKFTDKAVIEVNVLDVNQNKPFFKEPSSANASVLILENVPVNHLVMKAFAEDKDPGENGRVTYHFKVGNNNTQSTDEFTIDENTGELRTRVNLDREKKSNYQLILIAKDHGTQTTYETIQFLTIILKDIDDNKPMFQTQDGSYEYIFSINENNREKQLIGKVVAEDLDEGENAKIYYFIIKGNENSMFAVDRRDGSVFALGVLDRERNDSYEFYVKASNNANYNSAGNEIVAMGDPTIARVVIMVKDLNDNPPRFAKDVYYAGVKYDSIVGEFVADVVATDPDEGPNGELDYNITHSYWFKGDSNESSGSLVLTPFEINAHGRVLTRRLVSEYNQNRFELHVRAVEKSPPNREVSVKLNVWIYQIHQLVRVVMSRPPQEVKSKVHSIVTQLANVTGNIVVADTVGHHMESVGKTRPEWCDMYMHMIDNETRTIVSTNDVLRIMDDKYDSLKKYYPVFAIENFLPAYAENTEQPFEPALAALVALTIVLLVGCASILVLCCCFRHWIVMEPLDMKCDMLIKKPIIDDLSTTENPLWIEQKLKLYEEQELTMQVFCEPETNRLPATTTLDRRGSDETSVVDNTYATIQQPGRRNSVNTMLSMGPGDYATLGGSVLPMDKTSSHSQQMIEAALGFQGCTFQVPEVPADTTELLRARSELRMNKDGQPEFVSELM